MSVRKTHFSREDTLNKYFAREKLIPQSGKAVYALFFYGCLSLASMFLRVKLAAF